jgi:hypothetical protein
MEEGVLAPPPGKFGKEDSSVGLVAEERRGKSREKVFPNRPVQGMKEICPRSSGMMGLPGGLKSFSRDSHLFLV